MTKEEFKKEFADLCDTLSPKTNNINGLELFGLYIDSNWDHINKSFEMLDKWKGKEFAMRVLFETIVNITIDKWNEMKQPA
jgi:hypothetical protein